MHFVKITVSSLENPNLRKKSHLDEILLLIDELNKYLLTIEPLS